MSERKYDEDLGKALRFTFDLEPLKTSISGFGSGTFTLSENGTLPEAEHSRFTPKMIIMLVQKKP